LSATCTPKALTCICTFRASTRRRPGGKALFQMMGVFAEFERAIIRERACAGLAKARAQGKRLGRPKVSVSVERSIQAARAAGKGQLAIARELGVGVGTVRRVLGLT
jgi:DNA invertase Pin-like site-specific DNA recombinase